MKTYQQPVLVRWNCEHQTLDSDLIVLESVPWGIKSGKSCSYMRQQFYLPQQAAYAMTQDTHEAI